MPKISQNENRIYIFETVNQVPSIDEVILYPNKCKTFIDSITLNPKNVNTELYSQISRTNYSSFVYSFAYQFNYLNKQSTVCEQFEMNARILEMLCRKKSISLSVIEHLVLDKCKKFHLLELSYDDKFSLSQVFLSELSDFYL